MSRKKATICYIIFIIVAGFLFIKFSGRYFTPEQVLHANEFGLHYGPSEKVLLKYKGKDNNMLVIGKVDDRTLSVIPAKRSLFVLWKMESGGIPGCVPMRNENDRILGNYSPQYEVVYGLTDIENAKSVKFYVEHKNNEMPDFEKRGIYEVDVDEEGFFYMPLEKVDEESWYYVIEMAVYDENGTELCRTEW